MNSVTLIGRVTRDQSDRDFGYTTSGTAKLSFSVAVNERYGKEEYVSFFDCVVWGKLAEGIRQYITKGKQVAVSGRLRQERWTDRNGENRSAVRIHVAELDLLGGQGKGQPSGYAVPDDPEENIPF